MANFPEIDTTGYEDFGLGLGLSDISHPQGTEVRIDPALNGGADVVATYTGYVLMGQKGASGNWLRGNLRFPVQTFGRKWYAELFQGPGWTLFHDGSVTLSLAAIFNKNVANNAGWAVDAAIARIHVPHPSQGKPHLVVEALLAVSDNDGILYRLAYQVTALGRTITGIGEPSGRDFADVLPDLRTTAISSEYTKQVESSYFPEK